MDTYKEIYETLIELKRDPARFTLIMDLLNAAQGCTAEQIHKAAVSIEGSQANDDNDAERMDCVNDAVILVSEIEQETDRAIALTSLLFDVCSSDHAIDPETISGTTLVLTDIMKGIQNRNSSLQKCIQSTN